MRSSGARSTVVSVQIMGVVLLFVAGCQSGPAPSSTSAPPPANTAGAAQVPEGSQGVGASNPVSAGAAQEIVAKQEVLAPIVVPPNVEALLGRTPERGGGGDISGCERAAPPLDAADPKLYTSSDFVDIGALLSICYVSFAPGPVTERIFDQDGNLVRETAFTIDLRAGWRTEEANDFAGLPTRKPGVYRVTVEAGGQSFETNFKMTDKLVTLPDTEPTVALYGPGPTAASSRDASHLFLFGFVPNDTVRVLFYAYCEPDDRVKNVRDGLRFRQKDMIDVAAYRAQVQVPTDERGNAIAETGPLLQQLNPLYDYQVIVTELVGTDLIGDPNVAQPICPLPPNIEPLPIAAPVQERDLGWTYAPKDEFFSRFLVTGNVVLVDPGRSVRALDKTTGALRWSVDSERFYRVPFFHESGVYLIDPDQNLEVLDPATGERRWTTALPRPEADSSATAEIKGIDDGTIYIFAPVAGMDTKAIYTFDVATGAERFTMIPLVENSRPLFVAGGTIYVSTDTDVHAIEARDGNQRWAIGISAKNPQFAAVGDNVYVGESLGQQSYLLRALDGATGQERWQYQYIGEEVEFVAAEHHIFISNRSGALVALDPATGAPQWSISPPENGFNPVEIDGVVYVGSETGRSAGALRALDGTTGQERWRFATQGDMNTNLTVNGDLLYLGSTDGYLYAIDRATGQGRWAFKAQHLEDIYDPVVLSDDIIYFYANNQLYALR